MASEHNANSRLAGNSENPADPCNNLLTVFDLTDNAHLHVIDKQGQSSWIENIVQCFRAVQAESLLHIPLLERVFSTTEYRFEEGDADAFFHIGIAVYRQLNAIVAVTRSWRGS